MVAVLKCLSGIHAGSQLELSAIPIMIGRDPKQSNLVMPENQTEISGRHVAVWFEAARQCFVLQDFSTNGTYMINGERIPANQHYVIHSGTQFYLSNMNCLFVVEIVGQIPNISPQSGCRLQHMQSAAGRYTSAQNHAGFWKRFLAVIIDSLVVGIPCWILTMILAIPISLNAAVLTEGDLIGSYGLLWALGIVINWLYCALMESSKSQGTLGKMALGIKVTDLEGYPISFSRASGRHFAKMITALIPLGIGYMLAGWTERKQGIHDMIAGCLVENK